MDKVLLRGWLVEALGLFLIALFGKFGVDVPVIGFEDGIATLGEVLAVVGWALIGFSKTARASAVAYYVERKNKKIKKEVW